MRRTLMAIGLLASLITANSPWSRSQIASAYTPSLPSVQYQTQSGGLTRTYRVYRPSTASVAEVIPLVIMLHGGFGSGEQAEAGTGWDAQADQHTFAVVIPMA